MKRLHFFLLFLFVAIANGLPFLAADYIPLWDWPFHLARAYVIRNIEHGGDLGSFYQIHSWLMPNIASDIGLVWLMSWFEPYVAGRIFVYLTLFLTMSGVGLISYALNRRLMAVPLLISAVLVFNGILIWGFINYLFGLALALGGIGTWILIERRSFIVRMILGFVLSGFIFFAHFAAFGIYTLVIFTYSFQAFLLVRKNTGKNDFAGIFIAILNIAPLIIIFILGSPMKKGVNLLEYPSPFVKIQGLIQGLITYNAFADVLSCLVIILIVAFGLLHRRGMMKLENPLLLPLLFLACVYFFSPHILFGSAFFESRLPIAFLFLFVSSIRDDFVGSKYKFIINLLIITVFIRSLLFAADWKKYGNIYQEYINCFNSLPKGAIMGVVRSNENNNLATRLYRWQPPVEWVASYATIEKHIFIPQMIAEATKQPFSVKAPYSELYKLYSERIDRIKNHAEMEIYIDLFRRNSQSILEINTQRNLLLLVLLDEYGQKNISYTSECTCRGNGFYILDLMKIVQEN
jgi:hypothetical protein